MSSPTFAIRRDRLLELVDASVDTDGWARLWTRRLAEAAGCARSTARADLARLAEKGLIEFEREQDECGGERGFRIRRFVPRDGGRTNQRMGQPCR